ncbi:MAG: LTA synthase family protein [Candidatus Azobacteroides sp.]|nr:LTA synthase family protein [Candidatus Azobacteroides sp.]
MDLYPEMTFSHFLHLMAGGVKFDLVAVLYTNSLFILGNLLPFRFRYKASYQKVLKWIFCITNSIVLAFNLVDVAYFRFTNKRTTWSVFQEFANDKGNFSLMGEFLAEFWYLLLIFVVFVVLMIWCYNLIKVRPTIIAHNAGFYIISIVIMALGIILFVGGVRGGFAHSTRPITISNAAVYVNKPAEIGIVLNTPFSIYRTLKRSNYKRLNYFTEEELDRIYTPEHYPVTNDSTAFVDKNVVILIVESLSKEYISFFNKDLDNGNYKGYTPFLDSLLTHCYTFKHSFGNGLKSIDAMPSVLASIPSFPDPYVLSVYANNSIKGLAALLKEKGYDTSFFHGAPNGSMGFDSFARMSGFSHYYGKTEYNNDADFDGMWAIWDEPFLQFMARVLNEKPEPFFGAVFTATSHHPFAIPKEYEGKFDKGDQQIHQTVGYTDMALRNFFDAVSKMPWYKNTLFVITADHPNQVSYEKSKTSIGPFLIPIIYFDPTGVLQPEVVEAQVTQQIDIMPTVLSYLNYDKPFFAFGSNALNDSIERFAINYNGFYQIYENNYVLQVTEEDHVIGLYNYDEDLLLKNEIKDKNPEIVEKLESKFKAFRQQYNQKLIDNRMIVE